MTLFSRPPLLALLLVLVLVAFGIERLVVTDGERLEAWAEAAAAAAQSGDRGALEALLAPEFRYRGKDRERTLDHIADLRRKYTPPGVRIRLIKIEVDGDGASADARVDANGMRRPVRLDWVRREGSWLLVSAE